MPPLLAAQELLVELDGLRSDSAPGERFLDAASSGFAHGVGFSRVVEDAKDFCRERAREFVGMHGESGDGVLFKRNEAAGDAFDHDFEDASCGAGDDGSVAGHSFEIDDAEGLIHRGATEHRAVTVELDGRGAGEHLLDPDDVGMSAAGGGDFLAHLGGDLRRVGRAGAEDDLGVRREIREGIDEMGDAFLACDAAHEEDVGTGGIHAVCNEGGGVGCGLVLIEIDAVVDDMNAVGIDGGVGAEDVRLGALGDGDDGVGRVDGGVFHPRREGVAAAELLGFPGAKRLKRMRGEDEGGAVEFFGEETRHGDVPGVGVDDVDGERLHLEEIEAEGFQSRGEFLRRPFGEGGPGLLPADVEPAVVGVLIAPAVNLDVDGAGELAAEVFDVDAGASIDGGRILSGHEGDAQRDLQADGNHLSGASLRMIVRGWMRRCGERSGIGRGSVSYSGCGLLRG